ncbi:hypothetical protein ALC62_11973 [Cyphomyrmex costatus]|uniref:CCHC-type domain-containing protein n=1 Tax=Cyphomyrmex costatus TaxID=456900 RepID=A0A151IC24_9HYME|nr:hypothetical protein ALC62_11973 [Cyphomyrmex costatus]
MLVNIVGNDINEIKKSGKGKIRVELRSDVAANNLVNNNALAKHNLKAFIPLHRVMRTGIIKDVPQEVDVKAVQEALRSPCKRLPKYVYLYKIRHEVSPYVPRVRNCYSCFRVGHISKSCKNDARCLFCGKKSKETHPEGEECHLKTLARQSPRCINCLGGHLATYHECPIIHEHKVILNLAASENISLMDAKMKVRYGSENIRSSPSIDPRLDFQEFPLLDSRSDGREHRISPSNLSDSFHKHPRGAHGQYVPSVEHTSAFVSMYADKIKHSVLHNNRSVPRGANVPSYTQNRRKINRDFKPILSSLGASKKADVRTSGRRDGLSPEHMNCLIGSNGRMPLSSSYDRDCDFSDSQGPNTFDKGGSINRLINYDAAPAPSFGDDSLAMLFSALGPLLSDLLSYQGGCNRNPNFNSLVTNLLMVIK